MRYFVTTLYESRDWYSRLLKEIGLTLMLQHLLMQSTIKIKQTCYIGLCAQFYKEIIHWMEWWQWSEIFSNTTLITQETSAVPSKSVLDILTFGHIEDYIP
jgi:hypothetical protein